MKSWQYRIQILYDDGFQLKILKQEGPAPWSRGLNICLGVYFILLILHEAAISSLCSIAYYCLLLYSNTRLHSNHFYFLRILRDSFLSRHVMNKPYRRDSTLGEWCWLCWEIKPRAPLKKRQLSVIAHPGCMHDHDSVKETYFRPSFFVYFLVKAMVTCLIILLKFLDRSFSVQVGYRWNIGSSVRQKIYLNIID